MWYLFLISCFMYLFIPLFIFRKLQVIRDLVLLSLLLLVLLVIIIIIIINYWYHY